MYFRNLRFAKYVVREVPKKSRLRTPSRSYMVNGHEH